MGSYLNWFKGQDKQTPVDEGALINPASDGNSDIVQLLLDHKADVNIKNDNGLLPYSLRHAKAMKAWYNYYLIKALMSILRQMMGGLPST